MSTNPAPNANNVPPATILAVITAVLTADRALLDGVGLLGSV